MNASRRPGADQPASSSHPHHVAVTGGEPVDTTPPCLDDRLRLGAFFSLLGLIALCILWETVLSPLRPGGSWLVLKVLPLFAPLRGVWRGSLYTMQWTAMLVLLYFMEGIVRATSDQFGMLWLPWLEVALSALCFWCAVLYVRPAKRAHRARRRASR